MGTVESHAPLRQHLIPVAVAAGCVAVALPGGGFGAQFRAGAALLLWWTVLVGLAARVWPRARVPGVALAAGGGLLALALLSGLSIGWASDDGAAFAEAVRAAGYLGLFALVVLASPAGSARLWLGGLAIGLTAVAVLALGSRMQPSLFPEQDLARLLPSVRTRLSYPLNYWNGLGAAMGLACVALAGLGAHARTRAGRAAAVGALPLPALALFLTSSRGGVVALAVGLVVLLIAAPARARVLAGLALGGASAAAAIALANARDAFVDGRTDAAGAASQGHEMLAAAVVLVVVSGAVRYAVDGSLERLRVPRVAAAVALAAALVAVAAGTVAADPGRRVDDFKKAPVLPGPERGFVARHLASGEGNGRYQFWSAGVDAFEAEPVRGIGAGGYEAWWAREGSLPYFIRNAHSLFVEVLAELGLLGLLALFAFLGPAFYARSRAPAGLAGPAGVALASLAAGTASAAIDWTWQLPAAFAPVVVAAGVLAGPALRADAPVPAPRPRRAVGVAFAAVGVVAVLASAILLVSETKLGDSRAAVRRGDLGAAATDAREAAAVEPWAAAPWLQLALVRERGGDLRGSRRALREALDRDPESWETWLVETRVATRLGDIRDARRALRRLRTLNPRSPLITSTPP
ncbi:MAG TPA: O-antigen ligase family protein [Thermoleophilaceae bacterium]